MSSEQPALPLCQVCPHRRVDFFPGDDRRVEGEVVRRSGTLISRPEGLMVAAYIAGNGLFSKFIELGIVPEDREDLGPREQVDFVFDNAKTIVESCPHQQDDLSSGNVLDVCPVFDEWEEPRRF